MAAHLILGVRAGELISQLDPPPELAFAAQACEQGGLWPVLVGAPGSASQLLASPIILYDYPRIAPESRADSCDATEIDELLLLRVLTLSDAEKSELSAGDPRARAILARAEALSQSELLRLHGRLEETHARAPIAVGERVRLCPKARADIFDLALAGRVATVRAVARDFEDRVYLSVTVDDDPGADLGALGLPDTASSSSLTKSNGSAEVRHHEARARRWRGQCFFGRRCLRVEVVRELLRCPPLAHVTVRDFGIRGLDLAHTPAGRFRCIGARRHPAARARSGHSQRARAGFCAG